MILADEPTGALDSTNAAHVLEIFSTLQSPERAVVMVTHDPTVARTAHRMISMRDGRIVGGRAHGGGASDERLRRPGRRRLVRAAGPEDPDPADHARPDHRRGRHGERRGTDRERQGRPAAAAVPTRAPTWSSSRPAGRSVRRTRPSRATPSSGSRTSPPSSSASATTNLSGVIALPIKGASTYYEAFPVPVRASDDALPSVLGVPVVSGRWLNTSDTRLHTSAVVLGEGIAKQYGYLPGGEPDHPPQRDQLRGGGRPRRRSPSTPSSTMPPSSPSGRRRTSSTPTASPTSSTSGPSRTPPRPPPT